MSTIHAIRLKPGDDLKGKLQQFAQSQAIAAGFILTAVGSLTQVALRFASQPTSKILLGRFEIVSLVGTISCHGMHLHLAVSDPEGQTLGGHLDHASLVYTTAEVVIGTAPGLVFRRTLDPETSFRELNIEQAKGQGLTN